jgi:hypothetical protein
MHDDHEEDTVDITDNNHTYGTSDPNIIMHPTTCTSQYVLSTYTIRKITRDMMMTGINE